LLRCGLPACESEWLRLSSALAGLSGDMFASSLRLCLALCLLSAAGLLYAAGQGVEVIDDAGSHLRLAQPAKRIISLAPHLTETLFAAGAGERVVGSVEYSDYPPVGGSDRSGRQYSQIDLERVIARSSPDLIIGWQSGNAAAHLDKLRALGFPVYVSQPDRIDDVASEIERLGVLAGSTKAVAERCRGQLSPNAWPRCRSATASGPLVRTFYQIWKATPDDRRRQADHLRRHPPVRRRERLRQLETMAPTVTVEAVLAANPEAIVASGMNEARPEWLDDWKRWTSIKAVARNNLFFVPPELIQRHTPRLLDGAERSASISKRRAAVGRESERLLLVLNALNAPDDRHELHHLLFRAVHLLWRLPAPAYRLPEHRNGRSPLRPR
jgi:iron complex transport system substrate-binding protein